MNAAATIRAPLRRPLRPPKDFKASNNDTNGKEDIGSSRDNELNNNVKDKDDDAGDANGNRRLERRETKSPPKKRASPNRIVASSSSSALDKGGGGDKEDEDEEAAELAKLRCASVQTEEVVSKAKAKEEREQRRNQRTNRCADYPGLAFGSAMFGSDTLMKFSIIKNELHNIMRSQLRRVDGEMAALGERVKGMDDNLALSEGYIKSATQALNEAVAYEVEHRSDAPQEEDALSQFDAQLKLLEGKLLQARSLAAQTMEDT